MDNQLHKIIKETAEKLSKDEFPENMDVFIYWQGYRQSLADILNYLESNNQNKTIQIGRDICQKEQEVLDKQASIPAKEKYIRKLKAIYDKLDVLFDALEELDNTMDYHDRKVFMFDAQNAIYQALLAIDRGIDNLERE